MLGGVVPVRIQRNITSVKKGIQQGFGPIILSAVAALSAASQVRGPLPPPPRYEVKHIPIKASPEAPPLPAEEIIRRFTRNEDVMKQGYDSYSIVQTVRVQEIGDADTPGGEFSFTGEIYTKADGRRFERVLKPVSSTLRWTTFTLEDVKALAAIPLFILTTDELPHYDLTYEGQQKLDQLNTYIFRVKPKQLARRRKFFDGVVWVDDHDFAIVKSSGEFVSEISGAGPSLPFTMFDTYRENFQGKYWLPTYTSSEDYLKGPNNARLRLRLVIRSTDFQPGPGAGAPAPPPAKPEPRENSPGN